MKTRIKTRWALCTLVLVCLLLAVPTLVLNALADEQEIAEITEVSTWAELYNAVNSDKTYIKLVNNIMDTVPNNELPSFHRLVFDGGKDYVLDLDVYELKVLNHINEYFTGEFSMIKVSDKSNLEIKGGSIVFSNYSAKSNRRSKGVIDVGYDCSFTATNVNMYNRYTGTVVYADGNAEVTLEGGEYSVMNGFAVYLENSASLTLNGPYIHTEMGDGASTQYVDGYGALYSESNGELVINDAIFKSGVQITPSQIDAFSIATHEVTINGQVLTEDIFVGTNYEAKQQNKEYYWYSWTGYSLYRTENASFVNPIRVISYEKKYPITVESGVAMVDGAPVTEASYGQKVTVVADTPEEGMEFVRWSADVVLQDAFCASTAFTMPPSAVSLEAFYGKEAVKSISVTVGDIVPGQAANDTEINAENGVIQGAVEWREDASLLMGDYSIFKAGKSYTVKLLVYPPEGNKFDENVSATVNGKNATVSANPQYAYIDYTFEPTPAAGFSIVYDTDASELGVGGKIVLNTDLMASQSAELKAALDKGNVTYQWYRNGEAIDGATSTVYSFTAEDATCEFYVVVSANGKTNYGHNVTCSSDLYQIYLNASDIVPGDKVPGLTSATPGVSLDMDSMVIYEILGENSYADPKNVEKAVLIPGKSYLLVGRIVEEDGVYVANDANVHVNGELMKDKLDASRFFYDFTVPEADFPVYYKTNGEIGIGVTLTVDIEKMAEENDTFKHALELQAANPTYKTVFYQWYKDGAAINGATKAEYTVKSTDKNSLIHCRVTLVDGKCGIGEQNTITNIITVINVTMPVPKNGEKKIDSGIRADGVDFKIAWYTPLGAQMTADDTYEEGLEYEILINFDAKEGLSLDYNGEKTKAYIYGEAVIEGGFSATGIAYYTTVIASHAHEYSDEVWDNDEYAHWQPCIKPNCPDPDEEMMMYTEHQGGSATCQTMGACAICGRDYLADHDFSVPDYQYVDEMRCANFCEHCDVYSDWDYHSGGVFDCQNRAVCEYCHSEYGKLGEHSLGEWIDEIPATVDAVGTKAHANCTVCEKSFDSEGNEIADLTIPKLEGGENSDGGNGGSEDNVPTPTPTPTPTPDPDPDKTPDDPSDDKDGLGAGAIVGIVLGSLTVAGIGGFSLLWFVIKKRTFSELIAVFKK